MYHHKKYFNLFLSSLFFVSLVLVQNWPSQLSAVQKYSESIAATPASPDTKVGVLYFVWHCSANSPTRNKVISQAIQNNQWGAIPDFHWRDIPQAADNTRYCTTDKELIRKHFALLEAARVDFIVVDFTNQYNTPGSGTNDGVAPYSMLTSFQNLLDVSVERGGKIKIIPWVSFQGNLHNHLLMMMGVKPLRNPNPFANAVFHFQGKPLIIASWGQGQTNVGAAIAEVTAAGINVKKMWGLHQGTLGADVWSFQERCQNGFREASGTIDCNQYIHPELASVSAAYQETLMTDFRTAVPRFNGRTFSMQLKAAKQRNTPLVLINNWNEWIAQRFCLVNNLPTHLCDNQPASSLFPFEGRPVFVDLYNRDYSKEFEPELGSNANYNLLVQGVADLKGSSGVPAEVIGVIDGVFQDRVQGWACAKTLNDSILTHLYVGGPAGSGTFVGTYPANSPSESAVAQACQATGTKYRFQITVDANMKSTFGGRKIYIHGISPVGLGNNLLSNSGSFSIPNDQLATIYRFRKTTATTGGGHLFSKELTAPNGYALDGPAYRLYNSSGAGRIALYRCQIATNRELQTTQSSCEGQLNLGILGYLNSSTNGTALYRCYHNTLGHLFTLNRAECVNNGYLVEGILGYAP